MSRAVLASCRQRPARRAQRVLRAVHQRRQGGARGNDGSRAHGAVRAQGRTRCPAYRLSWRSHPKLGCSGWAPDRDHPAAGARGAGRRTVVAELRLGDTRRPTEWRDDGGDGSPGFHPALSDDTRYAAGGRGGIGGVQERGVAALRGAQRRAAASMALAAGSRWRCRW